MPAENRRPSASLLGSGIAAGEEDTQEHQRAAPGVNRVQRLAEEDEGKTHPDEWFEIAKDGALPRTESGQAVPAEDEGQRGAADAEVKEEQQVVDRQGANPHGGQFEAGAGEQEEQTVTGAASNDGQGVA